MPRASLPIAVCLGTILLLLSGFAASQGSQGGPATLPVSAIRPGMKGYGLTVMRGEQPERFGVEVIDVLHHFRPSQDLILIRTSHPALDRAITVAGMSGSPIYIDGKLIGAYAYGWSFGKEPIAGVTPIANMLAELQRPVDPRLWKALGTLPAQVSQLSAASPNPRLAGLEPYQGQRRADAWSALRRHAARLGVTDGAQTPYGRLLPAATPLLLGGVGERTLDLMSRAFTPFGLLPVQAGGAAEARPSAEAAPRFVDGGSLGVQLVRGDISAMAVGTVTLVQGRRVLGFGHPMLNAGQSGLSGCTARVIHIVSSQLRSFKLAEAVAPLGALVQDRQAAIVVDEGLRADMIPLQVRVHGVSGAPRDVWNMEVASHRLLTSGLVLSAVLNALEATVSDRADAVVEVNSRVGLEGRPLQHTRDVVYAPAGIVDGSVLARIRLFSVLAAAFGNPFENARVTKIDLDLNVRFEHAVVNIVDAQLPTEEVDPGATVNLAIRLQRFDESERVELLPITIPRSAAGERLEIAVEAGDAVDIEQPKPTSLADLLRAVRSGYPATSLVVTTKLPYEGVKLRGELVRSLPGSAIDTFQPVTESDRGSLFASVIRKELPIGQVVTGSAKLKVNVRDEPLR